MRLETCLYVRCLHEARLITSEIRGIVAKHKLVNLVEMNNAIKDLMDRERLTYTDESH